MWSLVTNIKGKTQTDCNWGQSAEEDILTSEGGSDRKTEKTV
jgi:hypothetical protein